MSITQLISPEYFTQKTESTSVSPAEFDWSNSGLTDPLAADSGNGKLEN